MTKTIQKPQMKMAAVRSIAGRKAAKNPKAPILTNAMFRDWWNECQQKAGSYEDYKSNFPYSIFLQRNKDAFKVLCDEIIEVQSQHCEMEQDGEFGRTMKSRQTEEGKKDFAWLEGKSLQTLEAAYKELMDLPANMIP